MPFWWFVGLLFGAGCIAAIIAEHRADRGEQFGQGIGGLFILWAATPWLFGVSWNTAQIIAGTVALAYIGIAFAAKPIRTRAAEDPKA